MPRKVQYGAARRPGRLLRIPAVLSTSVAAFPCSDTATGAAASAQKPVSAPRHQPRRLPALKAPIPVRRLIGHPRELRVRRQAANLPFTAAESRFCKISRSLPADHRRTTNELHICDNLPTTAWLSPPPPAPRPRTAPGCRRRLSLMTRTSAPCRPSPSRACSLSTADCGGRPT